MCLGRRWCCVSGSLVYWRRSGFSLFGRKEGKAYLGSYRKQPKQTVAVALPLQALLAHTANYTRLLLLPLSVSSPSSTPSAPGSGAGLPFGADVGVGELLAALPNTGIDVPSLSSIKTKGGSGKGFKSNSTIECLIGDRLRRHRHRRCCFFCFNIFNTVQGYL